VTQKSKILVVGDVMLDHYLWGRCDRISPEAPVQVVAVERESVVLGGAGNVVNNLLALNVQVEVASVIGDDAVGAELLAHLEQANISTQNIIIEAKRKSTKKSRIIASNQQIMRYDHETTQAISGESQAQLLARVERIIERVDGVVLSDYGKGLLVDELTQKLIVMARKAGKHLLVDPKGKDYTKYRGATLITPNRKEAALAVGFELGSLEALTRAGFWLRDTYDLDQVVITLSEDGMAIFDESMQTIPTIAQEVFDVTGAGDTVIATLAYMLCQGHSLIDAAHYANAAAAVVVAKLGSATATHVEIAQYLSRQEHQGSSSKIKSFDAIETIVRNHAQKRVVFTNGCFDILHVGHVRYLEKAKACGDILIVGVNSDDSVRRLKGPTRPINPQEDRALILASLASVDFVVLFNEDTPYELIKRIVPDVLVKGGDYAGKEVVGSDIAKEVRLIEFVEGKSTTQTIQKIHEGSLC